MATKKTWDSDDELLGVEGGINAFPAGKEELDYDEDALLGNSDDETAAQDGLEGLEDLDDNDIIELEILDVDPELEDDGTAPQSTEPDQFQEQPVGEESHAEFNESSQIDTSLAESTNEEDQQQQRHSVGNMDSDSESDDEGEGHRGRFKSERSNIITLTSASRTSEIPDTLDLRQNNRNKSAPRQQKLPPRRWPQQHQQNSFRQQRPHSTRMVTPPMHHGGLRQSWAPPAQHRRLLVPRPQPYVMPHQRYPSQEISIPPQGPARTSSVGLLGQRPVGLLDQLPQQRPPLMMQRQQSLPAAAQPRTLLINPHFKGTVNIPRVAWEQQQPQQQQQQQQQQPLQQHLQMQQPVRQLGMSRPVQGYQSNSLSSSPYSSHLQEHSQPGLVQRQQPITSQFNNGAFSGSALSPPRAEFPSRGMDTDMRIQSSHPVTSHHHPGMPYSVSASQPLIKSEPRFSPPPPQPPVALHQQPQYQHQTEYHPHPRHPQQQQQQQQPQPQEQHRGYYQQERFRTSPHQQQPPLQQQQQHQQHHPHHHHDYEQYNHNMQPQIGQPIQTVMKRQASKGPVTSRPSATERLGPPRQVQGRPLGPALRAPNPATVNKFKMRPPTTATFRPKTPVPKPRLQQPPKPKQPTPEEIEEQKRRQRRLERFGEAKPVLSTSGKINLKRVSGGEESGDLAPAKQLRVTSNITSSSPVSPDEDLRRRLEEQKRLRKRALEIKERNRRAAAGPRRAELQHKLAVQGKTMAEVEGGASSGSESPQKPVTVVQQAAVPQTIPVRTVQDPTRRVAKTIQMPGREYKELVAANRALLGRGGRGRGRGAGQAMAQAKLQKAKGRGHPVLRAKGGNVRGRGAVAGTPQQQQQQRIVQVGGKGIQQGNRRVVQPLSPEQQQNRRVLVSASTGSGSSRVLIADLSNSTTAGRLRQIASGIGPLENVDLKRQANTAILKFVNPVDSAAFAATYNRHMLDLSLIKVSLLPE